MRKNYIAQLRNNKISMVEAWYTKGDWPEIDLKGKDHTGAYGLWIRRMDPKNSNELLEG